MAQIMRIWRGKVSAARAVEHLERVTSVALHDYTSTRGNRGAWVLSRRADDTTEVVSLSLWDSMAAISAFAGDPPEAAKYYDFDPDFLLSMPPTCEHWQVHGDQCGD